MKIAHDNGVSIVIGGSDTLVGSENEPEGSFAESLLRLGPGVCDRHLFLVCGAFVRLLLNHVYLRCHTHEKRILDFGYKQASLAFLTSLSETNPISLLRSAVGWGELKYNLVGRL